MPRPSTPRKGAIPGRPSDLRGVSRLTVDAVAGVTDLVEAMHRTIASRPGILGEPATGPASGTAGLVYRSVRGATRLVGIGLDAALGQLAPMLSAEDPTPERQAVLAALNGVLGDYLAASENPLATTMQLRRNGQALELDRQALAAAFPQPGGKLLVLIHGLCMNDLQWSRAGHDHGAALARDLGYTPLYLRYNSGLHVSTNGRTFAGTMEQLLREWPVPVEELVIVGHSMGGLVARSGCHYAKRARHRWLRHLDALVFLGTPHHGSPLERVGNWVEILVGVSPYAAPLARVGKVRSAGIKDLRYGNLLDEDWQGQDSQHIHDPRTPLPLPKRVRCYAIAATRQARAGGPGKRLRGDGLVPVTSALGQHARASHHLPFPRSHHRVSHGLDHFDLLSSHEVYEQIRRWLEEGSAPSPSSRSSLL